MSSPIGKVKNRRARPAAAEPPGPTSASRLTYHHGDLPKALRETTVSLLAEVGVPGLSLREVARRLGVSHRALYRHVEDKHALLAAVAEEGYGLLAVAMREAVDARRSEDAVDRLVAVGEGYLRFARREPSRYEVMFGPRLNEDERFPSLELAIRDAVRVLGAELKRAAPEAPSLARRDAGVALWAAVHGLSSLVLVGRVPLKDAHVARYVDVILRPMATGIVGDLRG